MKNFWIHPYILGGENPKVKFWPENWVVFFHFSLKFGLACRKGEASEGFSYHGVGTQRWFLATKSLSQIFISKTFISQIFISKIFISKIFISKIFISGIFISKIFIYKILYLGYYINEINISDITRYLCQFVG